MKFTARVQAYTLLLVNILVHLPFLLAGYGKEEDAWSNVLTARKMAETGIYEVSRLPGHPIYELLLGKLYPVWHTPFFFNGLSAIATGIVVYYTYQSMQKLQLPHAFWVCVCLTFIPVFFIAGTYTIDYNLALALIMASFYAQLNKRWLWAGVLLGLATGVRISSLGFALPWLLFLLYNKAGLGAFARFFFSTTLTVVLAYLLPYYTYGWSFLDFHKPPFPSFANIAYKLSFGVFGVPLLVYLMVLKWQVKAKWMAVFRNHKILFYTLILAFIMQLLVFLRLPFKAEFFIPALPFSMMLLALVVSKVQAKQLALFALLSCCFMGFDYAQSKRGALPSSLYMEFTVGNKLVQFDVLKGPVFIDQSKRKQKSKYVKEVAQWVQQTKYPYWLMAGWYWPELMYYLPSTTKHIDYLSTAEELLAARAQGLEVYYLQEINEANAKVYEHYLADSLGQQLLVIP